MSVKIFREDSPIGEKINRVEKLLQELQMEITIGLNQEIVFKDYEHRMSARIATSPSYRDGSSCIPRQYDEEKLFLLEW